MPQTAYVKNTKDSCFELAVSGIKMDQDKLALIAELACKSHACISLFFPAYTAQEVENVVLALYGDPSRVQEANAWLTTYQESPV